MAKDPVCGMEVDEKKSAATATDEAKTYHFGAAGCKKSFEKNPQKYLGSQGGHSGHGTSRSWARGSSPTIGAMAFSG